jgi:hypothetical protein
VSVWVWVVVVIVVLLGLVSAGLTSGPSAPKGLGFDLAKSPHEPLQGIAGMLCESSLVAVAWRVPNDNIVIPVGHVGQFAADGGDIVGAVWPRKPAAINARGDKPNDASLVSVQAVTFGVVRQFRDVRLEDRHRGVGKPYRSGHRPAADACASDMIMSVSRFK